MPVLGATAATGIHKRGLILPGGCLDIWKAARANHASQRVEVVVFGDSTTYGSSGLPGPAYHSWVYKLRALAQAHGYTDGGRGFVAWDPTGGSPTPGYLASGENLDPLVSKTGFINSFMSGVGANPYSSDTPGDTVTLQGYGTSIRVHHGYATNLPTGTFTYSVDGAAAVTVDAQPPGGWTNGEGGKSFLITGLSSGLHTITFTNTGNPASTKWCSVSVDFLKSTGLVFHKNASSGAQISGWFDTQNPTTRNYQGALALGLDPNGTTVNTFGWGLAPGAKPQFRDPKLAIMQLGTNNSPSDSALLDAQVKNVEAGTEMFIRMARAAGADPVICIPPFQAAPGAHLNGGPLKRAFTSIAMTHGVAVIDFDEVLGPPYTWPGKGYGSGAASNSHLPQAAYDAEAQFVFDNIINA